ncbi:39S ribosomal protein L35, mitochondrial [Frankliniella fusca]|uniref:Large ribosomal subunit protein bL35m n=1 Tax=Frankliniella fusca TaxID=407009 RepID=A0AAE1HVH3_9NEOP|nr:39S ribosomal protein L35, mitochondrial [Frankliniella fusca]
MLRTVLNSCFKTGGLIRSCENVGKYCLPTSQFNRGLTSLVSQNRFIPSVNSPTLWKTTSSLGTPQVIAPPIHHQQSRPVTKWTLGSQKRQTVRAVIARFRRLDWGAWIHRPAGCKRKRWKKKHHILMRNERHVFSNATRSKILDRMVSLYWRSPKYWVDDPYEPYNKREEYYFSRTKPRPLPIGVSFPQES